MTSRQNQQRARIILHSVGILFVGLNLGSTLWAKKIASSTDTQGQFPGPQQQILRKLRDVISFGSEPAIQRMPLPWCGGDCDNDNEVGEEGTIRQVFHERPQAQFLFCNSIQSATKDLCVGNVKLASQCLVVI